MEERAYALGISFVNDCSCGYIYRHLNVSDDDSN